MTWPGAVYALEVGIVGTPGVLTIDDTHRDIVLAVSPPQSEGYTPDTSRLVVVHQLLPTPGDVGARRAPGPMARGNRVVARPRSLGLPTQAATAAEAHNRLMLTKALDLSAKRKQPVKLPLDPEEGPCSGVTSRGKGMKKLLFALFAVRIFRGRARVRTDRRRRLLQGQDAAHLVGVGVGSGYDLNARALARYLSASTFRAIPRSSCRTSRARAA